MAKKIETPEDFVVSTGEKFMIKDIVSLVFSKLDMPLKWEGDGLEEIGIVDSNTKYPKMEGKVVVRIDERYFRPSEVDILIGDSAKARNKLGWKPEYSFDDIINEMINEELKLY